HADLTDRAPRHLPTGVVHDGDLGVQQRQPREPDVVDRVAEVQDGCQPGAFGHAIALQHRDALRPEGAQEVGRHRRSAGGDRPQARDVRVWKAGDAAIRSYTTGTPVITVTRSRPMTSSRYSGSMPFSSTKVAPR